MNARVHVIGAGLAGLAAALSLVEAGRPVTLYEAGAAAGGRCRSYFDRTLGLTIDNGNHLLLSGNREAFAYLAEIGGAGALAGPAEPMFPFLDLRDGARWVVRPNRGRLPWWVLSPHRRVPGTRAGDYLRLLDLRSVADDRSVAEAVRRGTLYRATGRAAGDRRSQYPPDTGLARLLGAVVRETLMLGGAACMPRFPRAGLSAAFVDPALARLAARGDGRSAGQRVAALAIADDRATALHTGRMGRPARRGRSRGARCPALDRDGPAAGLSAPDAFEAILNVHFRSTADPGPAGFIGLIGGTAEWVFVKRGPCLGDDQRGQPDGRQPAETIAAAVWPDVRAALSSAPASDAALARGEGEARDLRRDRRAGAAAARARAPGLPTWSSPATGRRPGCRRRSKVRSGPAAAPRGHARRLKRSP